jgi:hypothetical protein
LTLFGRSIVYVLSRQLLCSVVGWAGFASAAASVLGVSAGLGAAERFGA